MLHTIKANVPNYSKGQLTLSNGIDVKDAIVRNKWLTTTIKLSDNISAEITPHSDGTKNKGAINYYTIFVNGGTYKVKYLRQTVDVLNKIIAQIDEYYEKYAKELRKEILNEFKKHEWSSIKIKLKNNKIIHISPIRYQKPDGKNAIKSYVIENENYKMTAENLTQLAITVAKC